MTRAGRATRHECLRLRRGLLVAARAGRCGVSRPRLLDLFCGAGGAAMGYHRAGFDVVGVDIRPQPNYPFEFVQMDALEWLQIALRQSWGCARELDAFDAIHASPPCQRYTSMQSVAKNGHGHPDLIAKTRELLEATELPYVIENVPGAPLRDPFRLCGSSFRCGTWKPYVAADVWLQLRRHRLFETNWPIGLVPPCAHHGRTVGIYGDHLRFGRRSSDGELSGSAALVVGKRAMGIDWDVTWAELREAIPPAYTELIGHQLLQCSPRPGREEA